MEETKSGKGIKSFPRFCFFYGLGDSPQRECKAFELRLVVYRTEARSLSLCKRKNNLKNSK